MVLLLFAVLVPAACLLWFLGAAMRNERLATRQKMAGAYQAQLAVAQSQLQIYWKERLAELETWATSAPAPAAFARCAPSAIVDSAVLFDALGVAYPNVPKAAQGDFGELEAPWQEARRLEDARQFVEAAARYDALARETTDVHRAARAFQAEIRSLNQAGQRDAVIQLVEKEFAGNRFGQTADRQGRLIAANADLLALQLLQDTNAAAFQSIARRLAERLMDYENPVLAAPQRRFLMKALENLAPGTISAPLLAAEQWAADAIERHVNPAEDSALQPTTVPGFWQFTTPNRRVLGLVRKEKLAAVAATLLTTNLSFAGVEVALTPPDADTPEALVTVPAGTAMPGWRLTLAAKDREVYETAAARRNAIYLWTAVLMVAGMGILAVLAARLVRRQMALARMKSDLAATVSHELKTPLSSMRLLVDTLLESERLEEGKTREYLGLIAQENERLGRLIQNFLDYARLERNKHAFRFSLLPPSRIVETAVEMVRKRVDVSGGRLDVRIDENLPPLMADPDALATALVNLLENARKFSEKSQEILLHARAENGSVIFSVTDRGIGIAPSECSEIFRPFYQVDQRLSRQSGGCGLGLSIVQFITRAHQGRISVESEPGQGSTFTIVLPAASGANQIAKESMA